MDEGALGGGVGFVKALQNSGDAVLSQWAVGRAALGWSVGLLLRGGFVVRFSFRHFVVFPDVEISGFPPLPQSFKKQVPFDYAQGRLSTSLRSAQNDSFIT